MKNKKWFSTGNIFLANFPEMTVGELIFDRNNGLTFTRLLLSLSVAVFSWFYIEKPATKLGKFFKSK